MSLTPDNPYIYLNLAVLYKTQNNYPVAIDWLNKGISINPEEAFLYYNHSCLCLLNGKTDQAIEDAKHACNLDKYFAEYIKSDSDLKEIKSSVINN